jgi:hypothetical protein
MTYTSEQVDQFEQDLENWLEREDNLVTNLLCQNFRKSETSEYVSHGVSRRMSTLKHAIARIFEILPPLNTTPTHEELLDATNHLQAFVMNVYGTIDNMARIWCFEADVKQRDGTAISPMQIGLKPKHKCVRKSLSKPFKDYLSKMDEWFEYLEVYRDALAHRIPLYIPPSVLSEIDGTEYRKLELAFQEARGDYPLRSELMSQQRKLGTFAPLMMHSYGENARPIFLHGQLICDFSTVVEIGEHLLEELKALPNYSLK